MLVLIEGDLFDFVRRQRNWIFSLVISCLPFLKNVDEKGFENQKKATSEIEYKYLLIVHKLISTLLAHTILCSYSLHSLTTRFVVYFLRLLPHLKC